MPDSVTPGDFKEEIFELFNEAAPKYDRSNVEFYAPMGSRLIEFLQPQLGDKVLDVGAGRGACTFPAADAVGPAGAVVSIDISLEMVQNLLHDVSRGGYRNISVQVMDAEYPEFPDSSFDAICGSFSFVVMPNIAQMFGRYVELLRPSGRIALTCPAVRDAEFPYLPPVLGVLCDDESISSLPPEYHPRTVIERFNPWMKDATAIRGVLEAAGFEGVEVVDEDVTIVAPSGEAWVEWSHTTGMKMLWNHLDTAEAAKLTEKFVAEIDGHRDGAGPARLSIPIRFVTARRRAGTPR